LIIPSEKYRFLFVFIGGIMPFSHIAIIACCWCLFALPIHAQESDPQKLLWDSVGKLDVVGVRTALDKGANPNWVSDPRPKYRISMIYRLAGKLSWLRDKKAHEKSVEILLMLFKAGAKLQHLRDQNILYWPVHQIISPSKISELRNLFSCGLLPPTINS
jgi:hypothetical protein